MTPKPHQVSSVAKTLEAIAEGSRRLCLTAPTGSGKSYIMRMLVEKFLEHDKKVIIYTNRRLLLEQTATVFEGIEHGIRAAGHEYQPWLNFQISSIQTEIARLDKPETNRGWSLYPADLVLVDEIHLQTGASARDLMARHVEMGAAVVGLTATPIDLAQVCDRLIIGCTMSEGRACGLLVPAWVYGPDEPDLKGMGIKLKDDEFTEGQSKKAIMTPTIFGRVWDSYRKLNPDMKPSIGFAPGVPESLYFAREFWQRGVSSAHIDGTDVWINGERNYTSQSARDDIIAQHRDGTIKILWNRFVLREGIDMPWAEHLILATIYGSLASYIQSVGRGLRAYPGKSKCIIQDHGGNWHRFGSPNADREWYLEYSASMINGLREELIRAGGPKKEPARCPKCTLILSTRVCPCGYESRKETWPRAVVQIDGSLKMIESKLYRARSIDKREGAVKNWKGLYWGWLKTKKFDKTFREMIAFYQTQNNWQYPDPSWPFYPKHSVDIFRKVKNVPMDRLNPEQR
jgi:DNA repair protein RadD